MNKLNKTFSFISALCIILVFSFGFYSIWTTAQRVMLRSCVSSVAGAVVEYSNEIDDYARNNVDWHILTDDEAKIIFANEHISFRGCSKFKSQPQDLTEKNPKIAVKKNGEFGYQVIVWSKGFDNMSGTEDDYRFAFG
jgi:hypothetical protein